VLFDLFELLRIATRSRAALMAENLFRTKQLTMFQERSVRPHHADRHFSQKKVPPERHQLSPSDTQD